MLRAGEYVGSHNRKNTARIKKALRGKIEPRVQERVTRFAAPEPRRTFVLTLKLGKPLIWIFENGNAPLES